MPMIRMLSEFQIYLVQVMDEQGLNEKLSPVEYLLLKIQISGLALDYADGFYRDALRLKT